MTVWNKKSFQEWKERFESIMINLSIINETETDGTKDDPYICYCRDCKQTFTSTNNNLKALYYKNIDTKNYKYCPVCDGRLIIPGINDIGTKRPELIKYFVNQEDMYTHAVTSCDTVLLKCPDCGNKQPTRMDNLYYRGFKCNVCSDCLSYPNKFCRALLEQLPVEYSEPEYIRDWTKTKKYDGYFKLNSADYLLEFDGLQHFIDTSWSTAAEQQKNDRFKDKLAKENGFVLIRIDCRVSDFEYIKKNIYKSKLSELFNLDKIDWGRISDNTLKNEFLQVVDFYKNHKDYLIYEIANEFNIGHHKVTHYLQKADQLNMITYKTRRWQPERTKQTILNTRRERSQNIFEAYSPDGEYLGIFSLITDCARALSDKYPNITFVASGINQSLQAGKKYKGFSFKYINKSINHFRTGDRTKEICDYFLDNQDKTDKVLAEELGISRRLFERYRNIGVSTGLITSDMLKECAFKYGRLKELKQNINERK